MTNRRAPGRRWLRKSTMTRIDVMMSSTEVGTPRRVSLAAYSSRAWVGLLETKMVRRPRARRAARVSPAVGRSASPR